MPRRNTVLWCGLEKAVPGKAMKDSLLPGACAMATSSERCSEPRSAAGTVG
ncbi:hypothetical protein D3C84_1172200 [compost metagenome]